MRKISVVAIVCLACGGSGSASIDGLYQLQETVTASSCSTIAVGATTGDTLTVTTAGATATETISSVTGACSGPIDGSRVTWSCVVTTAQGSFTLQIAATFTDSGVSGTAVLGGTCQITESFSGARR